MNPEEETRAFIRDRLHLDPDQVYVLFPKTDDKFPYDVPVTLLDLFVKWLDLFGTPRRYFFEVESHFSRFYLVFEEFCRLSRISLKIMKSVSVLESFHQLKDRRIYCIITIASVERTLRFDL
jgi:hypothetical protein